MSHYIYNIVDLYDCQLRSHAPENVVHFFKCSHLAINKKVVFSCIENRINSTTPSHIHILPSPSHIKPISSLIRPVGNAMTSPEFYWSMSDVHFDGGKNVMLRIICIYDVNFLHCQFTNKLNYSKIMQTYKNKCTIDNFDIIGIAHHSRGRSQNKIKHLPCFPLLTIWKSGFKLNFLIIECTKGQNECLQY